MADLSETFKRLQEDPQGGSQHVLQMLETFLMPFVLMLDEVLDKRLVRTLLQCLVAIIRLRNNPQALWRSCLGAYVDGYDGYAPSAAAGTKRIGKLLRSVKWTVGRDFPLSAGLRGCRGQEAPRAGETHSVPVGWKCGGKSGK